MIDDDTAMALLDKLADACLAADKVETQEEVTYTGEVVKTVLAVRFTRETKPQRERAMGFGAGINNNKGD